MTTASRPKPTKRVILRIFPFIESKIRLGGHRKAILIFGTSISSDSKKALRFGTFFQISIYSLDTGDVTQLAECHNGIVEVVGSTPIVSTSVQGGGIIGELFAWIKRRAVTSPSSSACKVAEA